MIGRVVAGIKGIARRRLAAVMAARGDAARDAGRFRDAAVLYAESLRIRPDNAGIQVQCAHMFKESGDLPSAEGHYHAASRLIPGNADLALQMGHFYKVSGRFAEARAAYIRAKAIQPALSEPSHELEKLDAVGDDGAVTSLDESDAPGAEFVPLLPGLAPRSDAAATRDYREGVVLHQLGRCERHPSGLVRTVRGVVALRGFCIAPVPITQVEIVLGGKTIHRSTVQGGIDLPYRRQNSPLRKYVFNIWHDFGLGPAGQYTLELALRDARGQTYSHREGVVVAEALDETAYPDSDAIVAAPAPGSGPLDHAINARPSQVRAASRTIADKVPRTILVQRTDQLGDLVVSIPAVRRLRELFPGARLIGLLSPENVGLANALALFDETIVAEFPEDPVEHRRTMTLQRQIELRRALRRYAIDCAIDLSESGDSRPLLLLSGARLLYGFRPAEFQWLSAGFAGLTRDPANDLECVPHSSRILGLVEWIGVLHARHFRSAPLHDADRAALRDLGINGPAPFVVLHTGARLGFSRWPHFAALTTMLLERTGATVVVTSEAAEDDANLAVPASPRLVRIAGRLPFPTFDTLLSAAAAFVGNDSGPKHLASLRGIPVVSLHLARHNWNEWGQETGLVISRRVPCAGCGIHVNPEECGKDFACISEIRPEEVFAALDSLVASALRTACPASPEEGAELPLGRRAHMGH